jgi:hypothetical protein
LVTVFPFDRLVSRIRQQRNVACALDCLGKHALMNGAVARNTTGQNLAAFRDKVSQEPDIFEVNDVYLLDAKSTDSAPAKSAAATTARARTAPVKIIVTTIVVTWASISVSVFIICGHSYL